MIKSGSHRIGPKEIEDIIAEFPGTHEVAVVGREDRILGVEIFQGLKSYRQIHDKGSTVLDLRLAYNFPKQIRLSLLINNITNREYMGRPGDIRPPRSFQLQFRWSL